MAYLRHFTIAALVLAVLGGGFNLVIDPFDIYGMPIIARVNTNKSIGPSRFSKPLQVARQQPHVVWLGTSRVNTGMNPASAPEQGIYNMAIAGLLAEEMIAFARHAMVAAPVRKFVFGVDFAAFSDGVSVRPAFSSAVLGRHSLLRAVPQALFSYAALRRSRDTLRNSLRRLKSRYHHNGFNPYSEGEHAHNAKGMLRAVDDFLGKGAAYRNFPSFTKRLADFAALLKEISGRGIAVQVFIPPVHAAQLEAIDQAGLWPMFEDWKRGLARVCADAGVPLWDFAGYNRITAIPLAEGGRNFIDMSHFLPTIGDVIIKRLYGAKEPADFGVLVTPATVEDRLAEVRRAQAAYRVGLPGDVARIRAAAHAALGE